MIIACYRYFVGMNYMLSLLMFLFDCLNAGCFDY